jgi:hypothetical protein
MRILSAFVCAAVIVASAPTPADARKRLGSFGPTKSHAIGQPQKEQVRTRYLVPVPSMGQSRRPVDASYVGANGPTAFTALPERERPTAWEERCKPTLETAGADGLRRYRYAAPDCDLQVLTSR